MVVLAVRRLRADVDRDLVDALDVVQQSVVDGRGDLVRLDHAQGAVHHDPHLALFSGEDGLDAIRVLERRAAVLLRPGGVVGFEHADVQGESAPAIFTRTGRWTEVRDHHDLAGRPRFTTARLTASVVR